MNWWICGENYTFLSMHTMHMSKYLMDKTFTKDQVFTKNFLHRKLATICYSCPHTSTPTLPHTTHGQLRCINNRWWLTIRRSALAPLWNGDTLQHGGAILESYSRYGTRCCGQVRSHRGWLRQIAGKPSSQCEPTSDQKHRQLQSGENFDDLHANILISLWST